MFAKSDHVKRWLESLSAETKFHDSFPIPKLNREWANQNPCRPGKAIHDCALSYAERMQNGECAPPAIIVKTASGYVLLDGRQRVFAAQMNGASVFAAYEVLNPSPRLQEMIGLGANAALNGVRPPQDWLVNEAIKFMESHGATAKEASRIAGVAVATIESNLSTRRVRNALVAHGVEPQLANGTLAALECFLNEPSVLTKAYLAVEGANATVTMTEALVKDMLKQPGKGRFIALDQWKARPEIQTRIANKTGRKMLDKQAAFQAARALRTVLKDRFDAIVADMKEQDKREFAKLIHYICGKGRDICGDFY